MKYTFLTNLGIKELPLHFINVIIKYSKSLKIKSIATKQNVTF